MVNLPKPADADRVAFAREDYALYAGVVFLWGTSWIALHYQLGVVAPEVSIFWRFLLSSALMFAWAFWQGAPLRFGLADHVRFAALGLFLFSTNYMCFYYSGLSTPSGLLAVVFSLASVGNMLLGAMIFGTRPAPRTLVGALLGFAGIAWMFEPQLTGPTASVASVTGLLLAVAGTTCFCAGNMMSTAIQRRGVSVLSANTWSMTYGALFLLVICIAKGSRFEIEATPLYLGALIWLALCASVVAFAAYLTLLGRIGASRAGYSTVMYPVVALALSSLLEGYVWTWQAGLGLVLVMIGNLLVLTGGQRAKPQTVPE